jgi:VWFA-related protein
MKTRMTLPGAALRVGAGVLALALVGSLEMVGRAQQPVFRTSVEMIAVDVQVMDNNGNPIGKLGPQAFDVEINGRRRKVVSATFIKQGETAMQAAGKPLSRDASNEESNPVLARTLILAVDDGSFLPGDTAAVTDAARGFLRHLDPNDEVGLYVYPTKLWVAPTTQRAPLAMRLQNLVGSKEPFQTKYNLSPHEIVDITAQSTNSSSFLTYVRAVGMQNMPATRGLDPVLQIQTRECPDDLDCPIKIYSEGIMLATQLEHEASLSLSGLQSLLRMVGEIPGRKSVVLLTGGLVTTDRLDGRPDPGNLAKVMGQDAARANTIVYTIHVDPAFSTGTGPASKHGMGSENQMRDRALQGNWLEDFSRAAGGRRIGVPVGGGEFAFDRVLRETSAYYLLGVEPEDADRDGVPHELKVKVDQRGLTVRNRQWVVIPPRKASN